MIHKNWAELIKPTQLVVKAGPDANRTATVIAEPLERAREPMRRCDLLVDFRLVEQGDSAAFNAQA